MAQLITQKEMDILAFYITSNSIFETANYFGMPRDELKKFVAQPHIIKIKRQLKQGMRRSMAKTLDRLEGVAFNALELQMVRPRKNESRAQAAKIILDERNRRLEESEIAEAVDQLIETIETRKNGFMPLPHYEIEEPGTNGRKP